MNLKNKKRKKYVYVVMYHYDFEGGSLEAVYSTKDAAKKHPIGGHRTEVHRMEVIIGGPDR